MLAGSDPDRAGDSLESSELELDVLTSWMMPLSEVGALASLVAMQDGTGILKLYSPAQGSEGSSTLLEELSSQHAIWFLKVDQPVWKLAI